MRSSQGSADGRGGFGADTVDCFQIFRGGGHDFFHGDEFVQELFRAFRANPRQCLEDLQLTSSFPFCFAAMESRVGSSDALQLAPCVDH